MENVEGPPGSLVIRALMAGPTAGHTSAGDYYRLQDLA